VGVRGSRFALMCLEGFEATSRSLSNIQGTGPGSANGICSRVLVHAAAALICAPAIVRNTNLMSVRRLPFLYGPQHAGYVDRLFLHSIESSLQAALRTGRTILGQSFYSDEISVESAQRAVAFAQAHGFLPPYICIYRNN
jgi:hypothetical protein